METIIGSGKLIATLKNLNSNATLIIGSALLVNTCIGIAIYYRSVPLALVLLCFQLIFLVRSIQIVTSKDKENGVKGYSFELQRSKWETLGQMSAEIAHELSTPVSVLSLLTEELESELESPQVNPQRIATHTESIKKAVKFIVNLTRSMKKASRTTTFDKFEKVLLPDVIDEVLFLCRHSFRNLNIELKVNYELAKDAQITCRESEIVQVLLNLLNNAKDSASNSPEKWVLLSVQESKLGVEIAVIDSGQGICPRNQAKLFKIAHTTKDKSRGTGLGLIICKRIVHAHHGELYFDNKSKNTRFVVCLPKSHVLLEKTS